MYLVDLLKSQMSACMPIILQYYISNSTLQAKELFQAAYFIIGEWKAFGIYLSTQISGFYLQKYFDDYDLHYGDCMEV